MFLWLSLAELNREPSLVETSVVFTLAFAGTGYRLDEEARNIRLPQLKLDSVT